MTLKERIHSLQGHFYFPRYSKWIFFFLIAVFGFIYNYHTILFLAPQSLHQWRQCDCLSIALNYCQDHNGFFSPAVHNLGSDGTGRTVSDFPLVYFIVAKLWGLFGHHEFIYRGLNLTIFLVGLLSLFKVFENTLKDSFWAIIFSLLLFTSPMLAFYANNFLMNSTALSLAFIALFFFSRFFFDGKDKHLYWMALFFALAGLLKSTSLLSFAAIFAVFILERFNVKIAGDKKIFQRPNSQVLPLIGVFVIQVCWYLYVTGYNAQYNSGMFLVGILPYWNLNSAQVHEVWMAVWDHIHWDYFRRETQVLFLLMFLSIFVFYKRTNRLLLYLVSCMAVGLVLFVVLFFQALRDHDYYTLDMLMLIPFVVLAFLVLIKENFSKIYNSLLFRVLMFAFVIHNVDFARRRMNDRYGQTNWQNENYVKHVKVFEEISPYLRSIGINKEDKVISISDETINVSLYLMNQKGWTNYGNLTDSTRLREKIGQGAKYLLIYDKEIYQNAVIRPFIKNKIGEFKTVDIYRL